MTEVGRDTPSEEISFQITAVKYATSRGRKAADNFLATHDVHDGPMPMDFFVWAIVGGDRVIVVDTGANAQTCAKRGHDFLRCPSAGLAQIGIDPSAVTDIIVTHAHWDHMGNLDKFPNARLHIHTNELQFATGCGMCHPLLRRPYDVDQVCEVIRALYGGRVTFNEGNETIAPGVTAHHVGGHAPGLQIVRVRTARGYVVLASDAMHFYANAVTGNPFPVVVDILAYLQAHKTIDRLADSADHVIAGHDPLVLKLYPAWSPELQGIAARLDVAPCEPSPLREQAASNAFSNGISVPKISA